MEKIMWLALRAVACVAALRSTRSRGAVLVGRWAVGILMIVGDQS